MGMILVKHKGIDLLVEDKEAAKLVITNLHEITALKELSCNALLNFNDTRYSAELKGALENIRSKFSGKFIFGFPFDARSGELYALDKRISYTTIEVP